MNPETRHVVDVLKRLIRAADLRNRDVERRLGLSASYLSRLFAGNIELRFEHIVAIGGAIGLEPRDVFRFLYPYPKDPPTPAAARLREILNRLQPHPALPLFAVYTARTEADLDRHLERALWKVLQRLTLEKEPEAGAEEPGAAP
jgi:transcriptional regulator with XRE-family HTH domain